MNESKEAFLLLLLSTFHLNGSRDFYSIFIVFESTDVLIFIDTMPNIALPRLTLFLCVFISAQAMIARDLSSDTENLSPSKYNQQLYELYKVMRVDPNLSSISNNDLLLYIFRNFVANRQPNMMDLIKKKQHHQQQQQQTPNLQPE